MQARLFSPGWQSIPSGRHNIPQHRHAQPFRAFPGEAYTSIPRKVHDQASTLRCTCTVPKMRSSIKFSSVAQSCPTLCDPMNRSTPGLPVHDQLPEFTQTHAHRVGDTIQPSHPLSSRSPPSPNLYKHQGLFQ